MRTLSAADVARLLPMRDAIDVVASGFAAISRHEGRYPPRMHLPLADGDALVMPGYDGHAYLGAKIATIHPANRDRGKPGTRATYLLIDAVDGEPRLLCDGTALTALRTGAASGLATRRLAREEANALALFGAGTQAAAQLEAMLCVRPITDVRVVGRNAERTDRFVAEMRHRFAGVRIERTNATVALAGAQVVVTATNSTTPVLAARDVAFGAHVNAIGSFRPQMQELDPALFRRARLIVDQRDAVLCEAGEVMAAIALGFVAGDAIAELGATPEGARSSDDDITVFKMVGHAALDLFAAAALLARAT